MPILNIHSTHLIYGDTDTTTNPKLVYVDWTRHFNTIDVENPEAKRNVLMPGESFTVFSGSRSTSIDNTTTFSIALNPIKSSVYRITHTGGTAPAFKTARSFNASGVAITATVNNNATMVFTIGAGNFNAQVGDIVFIPGVSTGDSVSPFNSLNEGFWSIISASALKLTVVRFPTESFAGASEVVTPSSNSQFLIFSSAGVQVGDSLEISAGFSPVTQKSFVVSQVTATWVEFTSTESLPLETGISPTASGMIFYTNTKRFIRVEVDQEAVVRLNGDTGNSNRLTPRVVGDSNQIAHFEKWGPVWQLVIVNRSTNASLNLNYLTVE